MDRDLRQETGDDPRRDRRRAALNRVDKVVSFVVFLLLAVVLGALVVYLGFAS